METNKTIYLSIPEPMAKPYGIKELTNLQESCKSLGFNVYNPITLLSDYKKMILYKPTELQKLSFTLEYLSMSNIMIQFTEWKEDFRCVAEYRIAKKIGILILEFDMGGTSPIQSMHQNLMNKLAEWLKRN